jgi:dihydroorotate dehydrogenase (NAD+) catalytic subunit
VAAVRAVWPGLLVAKLTPNVTDIVEVAQAAVAGGASALALVNTYKGMVLDRATLRPYLGNTTGGLSGPAIKPLALRAVYEVYSAVDVPIIGMGGVTNVQDALEFISCGATVVSVGSALLRDPWACERMAADLEAELESRNATLADLLGRAHR